ncbi:hypothetical protein [Fodinicurvata fenggangensis]|uniref:hypothetical protein n=1 Tax=Fodinicurvata fenggangensis TaxID=1121830 RepID=UPI00047AB767|nr:hypothetical protein [Fodinicurvata fenggangensis]
MTNLLVLGSKPDPVLPECSQIDAVACANASAWSARSAGLPVPRFTVISAVLGAGTVRDNSGKRQANRIALETLRGLSSDEVWYLPRPPAEGSLPRRLIREAKRWRMSAWHLRWALRRAGYHYGRFRAPSYDYFTQLLQRETGDDPDAAAAVAIKQPSTGVFATLLGLADPAWDRVVLAGISFELTHAYAENPAIAALGTTRSKHAETDTTVLSALGRQHPGRLVTSEPLVAECCGLPLVAGEG